MARVTGPVRSGVAPLDAASGPSRELAAEALHLLRIRRGELAEPVAWVHEELRRSVAVISAQLAPIRSRAALESSYAREAGCGEALRLAYANAWLALDRRLTSITTRRRKVRGRG
jgi:hypothetical protein